MANGVLCKRCGYQEAEHSQAGGMFLQYRQKYNDAEEAWKKLAEEHPKLFNCKGYIPKTKDGRMPKIVRQSCDCAESSGE